jgi:hypothetical protein
VGASFRIEFSSEIHGTVCVCARRVGEGDFRVTESSTLGGVALRPYLDIPRKLRDDGTPDLEIFAFLLRDFTDQHLLSVGQVVELLP